MSGPPLPWGDGQGTSDLGRGWALCLVSDEFPAFLGQMWGVVRGRCPGEQRKLQG